MKFEADLDYISGYLRTGKLVGQMSDEEYTNWLTMSSEEQQELLWDVGSVVITSYSIEDIGKCIDIQWSNT